MKYAFVLGLKFVVVALLIPVRGARESEAFLTNATSRWIRVDALEEREDGNIHLRMAQRRGRPPSSHHRAPQRSSCLDSDRLVLLRSEPLFTSYRRTLALAQKTRRRLFVTHTPRGALCRILEIKTQHASFRRDD